VLVVGPRFNFLTANSVADDFSLPQLTNALGQGIGGLVIVANLTGPSCGPNNAPTTRTVDTALSRQVVTAPFASTVSVRPWHSFSSIGLMWLARRRRQKFELTAYSSRLLLYSTEWTPSRSSYNEQTF
jgi:hypothetical protein